MTRPLCLLLLFPLIAHAQEDADGSPPRKVVSVEITILEISGHLKVPDPEKIDLDRLQQAIHEAREAGVFRHLTRVRLSSLEQLQARTQAGKTQMVVSGQSQANSRGATPPRVARSYTAQETGTMASIEPRVTERGDIILQLEIEQTRLEPSPNTEHDELTPLLSPKTTLTLQTTVKVPAGQTVLVSGSQEADATPNQLQTYIMVRATVSD